MTAREFRFMRETLEISRPALTRWIEAREDTYGRCAIRTSSGLLKVEQKGSRRVPLYLITALRDLAMKTLGDGTWKGALEALQERRNVVA